MATGRCTGIGDVPVLGALFRSDRFQRNETELVIIITPYLVRPVSEPARAARADRRLRPARRRRSHPAFRQIARAARPAARGCPVDAGFILN